MSDKHGKGASRATRKSLAAQVLLWLLTQDIILQLAEYRILFITIFQTRNRGTQLEGI